MDCVLDGVKQWQTLAAGLLALIGAFITVGVMIRGINSRRKEIEEQRRRRLMACRAAMPADLSSIIEYTHDCALVSGTAIRILRGDEDSRTLPYPSLPARVVKNLQQLIEQLDDRNANLIADMLSCYQIQYARLSGELSYFNTPHRLGRERIIAEHNIEYTLRKTIELFLLAESMFKFARREEPNIPQPKFTQGNVQNALGVLDLRDVISSDYLDQLVRVLSEDGDKVNGAI
ncbi:MAG: hypothetical protein L0287_16300 [Anaerolineae bacterium]|nr:hypothetical protein [Anaerolineae bacterium]